MALSLDRDSVDELLRAITPSKVAEALGIAVVRRGATLRCICPFHDDNDPSLVLYDNWSSRPPHHHCFVCGADGDIFDMVRHVRHATFVEAADWLRSSFGFPPRSLRSSRGRDHRKDSDRFVWDGTAHTAFNYASEVYRRKSSYRELSAWLGSRQLPEIIASKAGLSFAVANSLTAELSRTSDDDGQHRVEIAMLEEIGLIRRTKRVASSSELFANVASRFRDFFFDARVIFPIQSLEGAVIGFAGRAVTDLNKDAPKYLYSPGLKKSSVLYRGSAALDLLKTRIKVNEPKEIFICEGLIDALRLESLGFPAVSLLGAQASKEQIEELRRIADEVAPANDLLVHIFLDRDKAGLGGSAKLALALAENGFEADFIWPTKSKLTEYGVPTNEEKDPDSLLSVLGNSWNRSFIDDSTHPTALPVIAVKLGANHSPDDVLDDEMWGSMSLGTRFRAATALSRHDTEAQFLVNLGSRKSAYKYAWLSDVLILRASKTTARDIQVEGRSTEFIADEISRLNVARVLAKSGADRGEVPTDEAAWRRLDVGATAFNVGLRERLQEASFEPLEPFDAVFVARDFEKTEPRLKAMPCPEDLVLQQYMLSETLTERFDVMEENDSFSRSIPAVRFYRSQKKTITTAEDGRPGAQTQTLSFAYQIDMDVLEGRATTSNQGMFRPYIECWREFIASLRTTANGFEEVYAIRLDLKRYYDRLYRTTVRDSLKAPFKEAIQRLINAGLLDDFAPSFRRRQNISDSVIDWFCEHSFGYQYYHPETGRILKAQAGIGIPQGPILSAWLATVALFPLDSALRKVLESINAEYPLPRAGYARYVDDIFLIADSPQILEQLRASVEDACNRLRLEAIPKGELPSQMTPEEFRELLTEGKALIGSGPSPEIGLLPLGDGEAGFETWQDPIQRASALVLLSDRRLYEADIDDIKKQVFTALNAYDLRPAELPKAARWIWYAVAKEGHETPGAAWYSYWSMWREVSERLAPRMNVAACPWHDPSLYALDGLERLLSSANNYDRNLTANAEAERRKWIAALSKLALSDGFFGEFASPQSSAPSSAGIGVRKLRRMFVQRSVGVRWIARQLQPSITDKPLEDELKLPLGLASQELTTSLVRAWFTDADGTNSPLNARSNEGDRLEWVSPLRSLFLWLHEAIVLFGQGRTDLHDPLDSICGKLREPQSSADANERSNFYGLLSFWKADLSDDEVMIEEMRLPALEALLAVCSVEMLIRCVPQRKHLFQGVGHPLPALPGIQLRYLVLKNEGPQLESLIQLFPQGLAPRSINYYVATAAECNLLPLGWEPKVLPVDTNHLAGRQANWANDICLVRESPPSKIERVGFQELRWAADCFESLARINHELEQVGDAENLMEFVPAWPFISASHWGEVGAAFGLFGPVVPRSQLGVLAFARDGKGRLRSHEVALADARLWRIGYAVTDMLGMVDELERFRALELNGKAVEVNTAQYVLSRLLGRLRGEGQPPAPGLPHPTQPHLTGSAYRALQLLRNFPSSGKATEEVQYLLSVEAETAAMRLYCNGHSDSARPGVLTSMLAELAPAVFFRLTEKQLYALPPMASIDGPHGAERRVVAAWRLLDRRLGVLESDLVDGIPADSLCAWTALRRSIRIAAVVAWIRALLFEMHLAGNATSSENVTVPTEWLIDEPVLAIDTQDINIGALFQDALAPKGRLAIAAQITPLGWLTLLTSQLNLYGTKANRAVMPEGAAEVLRPLMTSLAQQLAVTCSDVELVDEKWPFDACARIEHIFDEQSFESALGLLFRIETELGYSVSKCQSYIWGLQPQSKTFTDASGRQWSLVRGLIDQVGRDRHVETIGNSIDQRVWTQTTNKEGRLIGVSVLGETFAKTVGMQGRPSLFDKDLPAGQPMHAFVSENPVQPEGPTLSLQDEDVKQPEISAEARDTDVVNSPLNELQATEETITSTEEFFKKIREYQNQEWNAKRTSKSAGHVRFALFQFRIDDSYGHPMVDVGFPESIDKAFCNKSDIEFTCGQALSEMVSEQAGASSGTTSLAQRVKAILSKSGMEDQWGQSERLPSWSEHRRRRLIDEALRACHQFDVEVLVLPEYSVRPDTIEWLRNRLIELGTKLSVVAGTYRLHGTPRDLYFKESFDKIFGSNDKLKVFSTKGNSMEKSAFITLLQPMPIAGPGAVGVFSRRKKYHSMAMGEFINPSGDQWAPLASLEGLVNAIQEERTLVSAPALDVVGVVAIAKSIRPVERMAELICSELFASTHPVNHDSIRSEYHALRRRFGYAGTTDDPVFVDLKNLTAALGLDSKVDRRTILVVPACTTRSADYWIYGQSALLAAGLTTVFCAAVLSDPKVGLKGGGSCVIARSSWSRASEKPGHLEMVTPYSGWTRGIYYSRSEDVLSRKEQAVVIADIDPTYMNEGKPRPQALPVPVQLVAHLPLIEMVNAERLAASYTPQNGGFKSAPPPLQNVLKKANISNVSEVADAFREVKDYLDNQVAASDLVDSKAKLSNGQALVDKAKLLERFFSEPSGWSNRLECWSRNWREMPFYGAPPTLIDWLPVDLSPTDGALPSIFVPPWGADSGGPVTLVADAEED